MEFCGTPALTEYSCKDLPYITTRSRLLLRKEEEEASNLSKHLDTLDNFNFTLDEIQVIQEIKSVEIPRERMKNKFDRLYDR